MAVLSLAELTWTEVAALDPAGLIAILPVGAIEAHGPHLPLATDRIISGAMAREGAQRLAEQGLDVLLLPSLDYSVAPFGSGFPGTISVQPETLARLVEDVATSLASHAVRRLVIANSHLDPVHLSALHAAMAAITAAGALEVVFPDLTRKPWALRLGEEFRSGACHAGRFETSIVMSQRPELVREAQRRQLPPNPMSLSRAIRDGLTSFAQAGGPDAYFGDPSAASLEEGRATVETLGRILEEATLEVVGAAAES